MTQTTLRISQLNGMLRINQLNGIQYLEAVATVPLHLVWALLWGDKHWQALLFDALFPIISTRIQQHIQSQKGKYIHH